nr:RNA-directed DNA polymerase, eukaryota [Tanacetum cinerariifolium]
NSFIALGGLMEVPLGGLLGTCPNISAITLDRYLWDHPSILLREVCVDYGPIPFRMYHYWFKWKGFDKLVEETWGNMNIFDSNAILRFLKKLKCLKENIHGWAKEKKKSYKSQKTKLKGMLANLDTLIDNKCVDQQVINNRSQVIQSLFDLEKIESLEIAQKVKIKWSIEGDENSKFFHGILKRKRNQLAIRGIFKNGEWIDSPYMVKNEFFSHFKDRFEKPCSSRLMLDADFPIKLNSDQKDDLGKEYFGGILEEDVVEAVSYFFKHDFRPISLIGSVYKIIAKTLANRLVVVLGDIVNEVQSAFVSNRHILDGPFIINELIHWCKAKKKQTMIFKVDFEKAYDSVRWDCLDGVLYKFDDAIFMGQWSDSNISTIVHALKCFHKAAGLCMNLHKSKLLGVAVEVDKVSRTASKIGCLTLKTPFSYLGVRVGGLMSRLKSWDEVVNRLRSRLSKWKMKTLFIGGRLNLLKSVLGSMAIDYMSMYKGFGVKRERGLGVSSYFALNRALMFKWAWRFYTDGNSLWARFIKAIHVKDGKIGKIVISHQPSAWIDIVNEFNKLKNLDMDMLSLLKKKVEKLISVADKFGQVDLVSSLRRMPRDGVELMQFSELKTSLEGLQLISMNNIWTWTMVGTGDFSVASARKYIDDKKLQGPSITTRWVKVVPIKINIMA